MKQVILSCLCLLLSWPVLSEAKPSRAQDEAVLRVLKLETWPSYYRHQDVAGLRDFLTQDFVSIGADGSVTSREAELDWVAKTPWTPSDFTYTITAVRFLDDDTAIIYGVGRSTRTTADGGRVRHEYTSSNVMQRDRKRWRAALSHVSGVKTAPLEAAP